MANKVEMIVRLSFANGSKKIHIGDAPTGATLTGKVMWVSGDLEVSYLNRVVPMSKEEAEGITGILVMPELDDAMELALEINEVERPVGRKGNKVPFVYVRFRGTDDITYNGVEREGDSERIVINELDPLTVEVHAEAPKEILQFRKPQSIQNRRSPSLYGSKKLKRTYHPAMARFRKTKPQTEETKESQESRRHTPGLDVAREVQALIKTLDPEVRAALVAQLLDTQQVNQQNGKSPVV